jgi:hypothetical protein
VAARAVGRPHELDGALVFETPCPGRAVDSVVRQAPLLRHHQAPPFPGEVPRLCSWRWRRRHGEAAVGDVPDVRQFVLPALSVQP